jgi:hypothetical protein
METQPVYLETDIDQAYVKHTCDKGDEFFVKMIKPKNTKYLLYVSGNSLVCPICNNVVKKTTVAPVQ